MPEVFLGATGGYESGALELHNEERLPVEQALFAVTLGTQPTLYRTTYQHLQPDSITHHPPLQFDPTDLCGPSGTGGGKIGQHCSPPPSQSGEGQSEE